MPVLNYEKKYNPLVVLRVIKTLIYFNMRSVRPSFVKIHRFLINVSKKKERTSQNLSMGGLREILDWLKKKGYIESFKGFYAWKSFKINRDNYITEEKLAALDSVEDGKIASKKMKMAVRAAKILKYIPALYYIGVCGTVAMGNPKQGSDIDFFIIARKGRIWTVRFLTMLILEVLGIRKKKNLRRNRICLNHFVASNKLEMRLQDLYSAIEYNSMITLVDKYDTREKLERANKWVGKYLYQTDWGEENTLRNYWEERVSKKSRKERKDFFQNSRLFNWFEFLVGSFQARRIEKKRRGRKKGSVYWGKDELIFHPRPKSEYYKKIYKEKIAEESERIKELLCNLIE